MASPSFFGVSVNFFVMKAIDFNDGAYGPDTLANTSNASRDLPFFSGGMNVYWMASSYGSYSPSRKKSRYFSLTFSTP